MPDLPGTALLEEEWPHAHARRLVDAIIGADPHTGTHTAAVADRLGAHLATIEIRADAAGYAQLIAFAISKSPGPKIAWAAGGCGSHGAGLAARQALAAPGPAQPRTGDTREALRILLATREHATKTRTATVNTFKALILTAPEDLRDQFRSHPTAAQVRAA